ncbi:MAG TPA: pyridoxal phosphate-dependent aminotransferase [Anseongella sp.]|nr:pyridoxal phosphate-dependent aminotransferase [Anseongella sp.]
MSNFLSDRINKVSESATIQMAKKARELAAEGHKVISLSLGEPDFGTAGHIKEAATRAMEDGFTFYSPVPGYPDLRQVIVSKLKNDNGLEYAPDQIVVSTGAKQSIANLVISLINPDDEVIIPAPYWVSYSEIVKLVEGKCVFIEAGVENDFKITPQQLEAAITPKTKLFMYSSPCNPTGSVYSREELAGLAEVFARHPHVFIMSDEIYEYINFEGRHESIAQFGNLIERTAVINGCSKGYAMTGWRIGYLAAPKAIAQACDKIQGQITSGTCSIAQKAAVDAITSGPDTAMIEAFRERRDLVYNLLKEIPGIKVNLPEGAFYFFPDVSSFLGKTYRGQAIESAGDLSMLLLKEAHVAVVTGEAFGSSNCIRLSYATSEEVLKEAMGRIRKVLEQIA